MKIVFSTFLVLSLVASLSTSPSYIEPAPQQQELVVAMPRPVEQPSRLPPPPPPYLDKGASNYLDQAYSMANDTEAAIAWTVGLLAEIDAGIADIDQRATAVYSMMSMSNQADFDLYYADLLTLRDVVEANLATIDSSYTAATAAYASAEYEYTEGETDQDYTDSIGLSVSSMAYFTVANSANLSTIDNSGFASNAAAGLDAILKLYE